MKKIKGLFFLTLFAMFFPVSGVANILLVISIILFAALIYGVLTKTLDYRLFLKKYPILTFGWLMISFITFLWVEDYYWWLVYTATLFIVWVNALILTYLIKEPKFLRQLINSFFMISIIHNLIAWFEIFTGNYLFTTNYENLSYSRNLQRPFSFFYNTNDLATFLLFAGIIFLYWNPKKIKRSVLISIKTLLSISNFLIVQQTGARSITIALLIVYILAIYIKIGNKILRAVILNIVGISIILLIVFFLYKIIFENKLTVTDGSLQVRLNLMKNGIVHLISSYSFGVGSGNGSYYMEKFNFFSTNGVAQLHNWWLEILVMYGLLFFIIYIGLYFKYIITSLKYNFDTSKYKEYFGLIFIILTSFIIALMTSSSNFTKYWVWFVLNFCFVTHDFLINEYKIFNWTRYFKVNNKESEKINY